MAVAALSGWSAAVVSRTFGRNQTETGDYGSTNEGYRMQTGFIISASVFFLLMSPIEAQTRQRVADGVSVVALPNEPGVLSRNIGCVDHDDLALSVDVDDRETCRGVSAPVDHGDAVPAAVVVHTFGSRGGAVETAPKGPTRLAAGDAGVARMSANTLIFPVDAVLGDGANRAELIKVGENGPAVAFSVYLPNAGVLFAGDLVGRGRGSKPLPIDDWIRALERLERLRPRVVVPGRGTIGDAGLLRTARMALVELVTRVAEAVNAGKARDEVLAMQASGDFEMLPEGTVQFVYDEFVGIAPADEFVVRLGLTEGSSPTAATPGWTPPRKVIVADMWPGRTAQLSLAAPGVEVVVARDPEEAAELVRDADAILGWLTPEILDRAERLRWVALYSAGVESYVALPGFAASDVVLTNAQRLFAPGGAEHVLGLVLALSRRLHTAVHLQSERRWDATPLTGPTPITGSGSELGELRGKKLLVVGLGGIGTEVARLANGIGMRVIATRASRREGPAFVEYVGLSSELPSLVPEADVIVNCLPLTPETENAFDDSLFSAMKSTAYFVNIGRGRTVDTNALTRALRDGRIAGAGLDVTEPEPLPSDHDLWSLPNVIITPHIGGDSEAHMERIWLLFRENLRRFAVGEPLLSVVDKRRGY